MASGPENVGREGGSAGMSMSWALRKIAIGASALALAAAAPALAKDFTFSEKANDRLAKKLNIPIYFALPSSARADLPKSFNTTDTLVDFKHPDAIKTGSDAGLRLVVTPRSGMSSRLGKSGIVQTGDLLLTFRAEWGGAGAYPNVQMGISHTGVAYVKDGKVYNIDNPLNEEYLGKGMRADLTSEHYSTLNFIHVIRPRNLTDAERKNIAAWATKLNSSAKKVYPDPDQVQRRLQRPQVQGGQAARPS